MRLFAQWTLSESSYSVQQLYRTVPQELVGEKLDQILESFRFLRHYSGVLRLALDCAGVSLLLPADLNLCFSLSCVSIMQAQDPLNRALDWRREHFPFISEAAMEDDSLGKDPTSACSLSSQ